MTVRSCGHANQTRSLQISEERRDAMGEGSIKAEVEIDKMEGSREESDSSEGPVVARGSCTACTG
jgi:hypothetical protein